MPYKLCITNWDFSCFLSFVVKIGPGSALRGPLRNSSDDAV